MSATTLGITPRELATRMELFAVRCREAGVKLTTQRREIFREVASSVEHPDAETVCQGVRSRIPGLSLDTVYRTLWLLNKLGLIATLGPARDRSRFDANLDHHHHFVCGSCNMTRDFYSDALDELQLPDSVHDLGEAKMTQVEVRGLCHQCAEKTHAA